MAIPNGVALDAQGRILVATSQLAGRSVHGRRRRTVGFDRAFGVDVLPGGGTGFENCTRTAAGRRRQSDAAGGLASPSGVAVDAQGRIVVADGDNNRIDRFAVAGDGTVSFDRAFGIGVDPTGATRRLRELHHRTCQTRHPERRRRRDDHTGGGRGRRAGPDPRRRRRL